MMEKSDRSKLSKKSAPPLFFFFFLLTVVFELHVVGTIKVESAGSFTCFFGEPSMTGVSFTSCQMPLCLIAFSAALTAE